MGGEKREPERHGREESVTERERQKNVYKRQKNRNQRGLTEKRPSVSQNKYE